MRELQKKTIFAILNILILLPMVFVFSACEPPFISIFVGKTSLSVPKERFFHVQADKFYLATRAYTNESFASRLRDSSVKQIDIYLTNTQLIESDSSRLHDSLLTYWSGSINDDIKIDSIEKIVIYGSTGTGTGEILLSYSMLGTIPGLLGEFASKEQPELHHLIVRMSIGAAIGAGIGVLMALKNQTEETVLFRNYEIRQ